MCSVSTMLGVIINVNGCVPTYFACVVFLHILSFILLMLIIFMTVDAHNKVTERKKNLFLLSYKDGHYFVLPRARPRSRQ